MILFLVWIIGLVIVVPFAAVWAGDRCRYSSAPTALCWLLIPAAIELVVSSYLIPDGVGYWILAIVPCALWIILLNVNSRRT